MEKHSVENKNIKHATAMRHEMDGYSNEQLTEQIQSRVSIEGIESETAEAINTIASSIGAQYYALYHIWIESHTYVCFQEKMNGILSLIGEKGSYEPAWDLYIQNYIESEDQEAMREFAELSTMAERLRNSNSISHIYRRREIGWTRGTFIAGKRDEEGNVVSIIYTVTDINNEIEREKKEKQALYEAEHDSLTGAFNRNGLEALIASHELDNIKFGFGIIDIDNFKSLNDNYGHDIGDQVLKDVAEQLTLVFRSKDKLFRLGGDEFAILIYDCDETSWDSLCRKQKRVHSGLGEGLFEYNNLGVTLSCGICFSEGGYSEELYRLADEALYHTKASGRAGCTLIDQKHNIIRQWQDDSLSFRSKRILDFNNTGLCRIEVPSGNRQAYRMICGEATKQILAIRSDATPEECFEIWWNGIESSYRDMVFEAKNTMLEKKQVECTYLWNHPKLGKINVRSCGFGETSKDEMVLYGYHHPLNDTQLITRKDDAKLLLSALNNSYIASYYLNLEDNSFATFKYAPSDEQLQLSNRTMRDALDEFILAIVDPEDRESMRDFLDMRTLQSRLGADKYIDNEYRSIVLNAWCRVRLLPIKYNQNGKLTHVLFVISALDRTVSKERTDLEYHRKSLAALFHNVPGGVVMYEWDGKKLRTLHISNHYEKEYGYILKRDANGERKIDYSFVHQDDLEGYQEAIAKALTETHELHYEFRRWNISQKRYVWVHLDATSTVQPDGNSLVFALYTDVTERKEAELSADKRQASLEAALDVSDQICCEYDPQTHIIECLCDSNFLNLPKIVHNYPDSMQDYHFIHPNDMELFLKTAHAVDGTTTESCTIRCLKKGEYRWFTCAFSPYYDTEKNRNIAIFNMQDVTERMDTMHSYEERLRSLLATKENALSMCTINVSQDTFEMVGYEQRMEKYITGSDSFETVMLGMTDRIIGEASQKAYRELFCRENLLKQAAEGNMHIRMEYLLKLEEKHYEWITAAVELIKNPITEDIVGVAYSKTSGIEKMKEALLGKALRQDYMFAAVIFVATDEFYLYDPINGQLGERKTNFWEQALRDVGTRYSKDTFELLQEKISKENVISQLKRQSDYTFSYESIYREQTCRFEIRFSYTDEDCNMILASMRNITDTALLEQFRHDSEHDSLTDLYNRKTTFRKATELLKEHPDEQFVMLHADLQHFRLFNTFFGEAAGDQLLCDMADQLRLMDKDYNYWVYGRIEADVFCAFIPYTKELYEKHMSRAIEYLKNYRTDFPVEPAIGMYFVTDRDMPIDSMFTRATLARKAVKPGTPYATVVYDEALEQNLTTELQIINDMQRAIDKEQFEVYLQPKYSLRTNQPIGAEALVRWNHPERGMVSPGIFIPVFESNGFITTLDHYMWEHVCQILSRWKKTGETMVPISVNVSRLSMYSMATVHYLKSLVEKYDIEPKYLELELTESAYIDEPEEMKKQMLALRKAGFTILLDDFGSGYSSLNTLRELPVDVLKLDMRFLSLDQRDIRGGLVISSIIRMAKLLKLVVIAEGVETQEQADYLKGVGCEYVQGFFFARPMPVAYFENIIAHSDTYLPENMIDNNRIDRIEHVGRILAETGSTNYEMGTVIPAPLVCMEYLNGEFNFLRVNAEFFSEFNLEKELAPAAKIFKERLSAKSHAALIRAIEDSRQTGKKTTASILLNNEDGTQCKYICRVSYEGTIGETVLFVTVFVRVTDESLSLMEKQTTAEKIKGGSCNE